WASCSRAVESWPHVAGDEVENLEHPAEVVAPELQQHVRQPELLVLTESVNDRRRALLDEVVGEPEAQRELDRCPRSARVIRGIAEAAERLGELRGRLRRRVPAVAQHGDAAERAGAVAAHPNRRVWLLQRLRREAHVAKAEEFAFERRVVLGPQRLEHAQRLVGLAPALVKPRAEDLQLLLSP